MCQKRGGFIAKKTFINIQEASESQRSQAHGKGTRAPAVKSASGGREGRPQSRVMGTEAACIHCFSVSATWTVMHCYSRWFVLLMRSSTSNSYPFILIDPSPGEFACWPIYIYILYLYWCCAYRRPVCDIK